MKSRKVLLGAALVLATAFAQQAYAAIAFSFTNGSILNSKHDLSFSSTSTVRAGVQNLDSDQICIFCHTPHGALQTQGPLWNRGGAAANIANKYANGDTMEGEVLGTFATSSAACMTCHDGATGLDNLVNTQLGAYNSAGVVRNFGAGNTPMGGIPAGITVISALQGVGTGNADLRDDHPIGVPYCGGFSNNACNDRDFVPVTAGQTTSTLVKDGTVQVDGAFAAPAATDRWWINTDVTSSTRSKQDMTLFVRTFAAGSRPSVECATCHDVHNAGNGSFLRVSNARSALCLACHIK